ncbi:HTH domain-containing protein [Sphingobacterium phlebotomi]|uniref:HTH domain-containing protein n=1 Tax=Sphingobacterium phlebotomi TaxID=2605433 RepID=A0A5D4H8G5_9SPHI|nr:HTH domain-containing protein [Sphingobacterium phlebotomi]TYR36877.1 HTH domain-containing protein [Sphingobacterium phlebotomi]
MNIDKIKYISLRDRVFREVISNLLIHREFGHAYPAKLIIEKDQVITENWNRAQGIGNIDPNNFTPYPKNPVIARFFKEIGWVDELGSGVRNVYKYTPIYTPGAQPLFIEGDVFKTVIPLSVPNVSVNEGVNEGLKQNVVENVVENVVGNVVENENRILVLIRENNKYSAAQMADRLEMTSRTVQRYLKQLQEKNKIERIGPAKGGYWKINQ